MSKLHPEEKALRAAERERKRHAKRDSLVGMYADAAARRAADAYQPPEPYVMPSRAVLIEAMKPPVTHR